jgi:hypothetical protein
MHHDVWAWILHNLPFFALIAEDTPPNRPMVTRIVEQVIVGVIAAAAVLWANDKVQDNTIANVVEQQRDLRKEMATLTTRLESRIDRVYDKLDAHDDIKEATQR